MTHISPAQAVRVWFFLVAATLISAWLAEHHGLAGQWTATAVIGVAAFKVRLVMLNFMELKHAPWRWRAAFEAWTAVVALLIIGVYYTSLR
ncbi:MAG: cytochrome C oxidase subunit IV family protein [Proteobacteria bacterium]|nr:cytochrome C oxidase subunit IV family protein [Pseudomonadota bacterium]